MLSMVQLIMAEMGMNKLIEEAIKHLNAIINDKNDDQARNIMLPSILIIFSIKLLLHICF
jgi:hypothetical protein